MTEERKKRPEAIVGALVINNENKFLLAKNTRWGGKYVVFGGHVEWDEALEESIRREVKEEAGLDVDKVIKLGFDEYIPSKDMRGHYADKHMIFLDFLCTYTGPDADIVLNDEYEKGSEKWVSIEEALKLDLGGSTLAILERYQEYIKTKDVLNDLKRAQADFENYKKRQAESQKGLKGLLIEKLVLDIVPVLDNFRSATQHVPPEQAESPWVKGIQYIEKQLETVLVENGIQTIDAKEGDVFDPTIHEAVGQTAHTEHHAAKQESREVVVEKEEMMNIVSKVVQKGYKFGERVIRPARVIVN